MFICIMFVHWLNHKVTSWTREKFSSKIQFRIKMKRKKQNVFILCFTDTMEQSCSQTLLDARKCAYIHTCFDICWLRECGARGHGQQRGTVSVVWRWRGANLNSVSRDTVGASVTSNTPSSAIRATVAVVCALRGSHPILWCGAATGQWKHQLQPETRESWRLLTITLKVCWQ